MTTATVVKFMQKTAEDRVLRQELEALLGVGDGDISSEAALDAEETAALKGEGAPIVTSYAAKHGYAFSAEDLIKVVEALQKHQAGELSDADFKVQMGVTVPKALTPSKRMLRYLSKTYLGY
jgi:2C-methyl-D-erythritol 2,4-cyclodiphosphate synthase